MENTHEHLEQIEHAEHAAHDHFNRNVAVTMAIVAAVLAAVTVQTHRLHNDTLLNQMKAADEWNYYQAKNNRGRFYEAFLAIDDAMAKDPSLDKDKERKEHYEKERANWQGKLKEYQTELPDQKHKAEGLEGEAHLAHERGLRFDFGELFVEMSLVLSSMAMLTKRRSFWYAGMGAGVLGLVVALSAFLIQGH